MWEIKKYDVSQKEKWDAFVANAKNGTFLFFRDYMDYHSYRFVDFSLMAYFKGKLTALLPANIDGDVLFSHQGLTYGGWISDLNMTSAKMCDLFRSLNDYLRIKGIKRVIYKALPWIYHKYPSEEDLYALINVCDARLVTRHISSTINFHKKIKFTESRKSGLRKAKSRHLIVKECSLKELPIFWNILEENLAIKHNARPVHSLEEMSFLMQHFPNNIKLFVVFYNTIAVGGTILYINTEVVHTQYISANKEGKLYGALDILFDNLLEKSWSPSAFFDFGKSSDGNGEELNDSLIFQKEGFGGRGVCYDWYEWNL